MDHRHKQDQTVFLLFYFLFSYKKFARITYKHILFIVNIYLKKVYFLFFTLKKLKRQHYLATFGVINGRLSE